MTKHHDVANIHFENNELVLIVDGKNVRYALHKLSSKLLNASPGDRNNYEISPSGYGIHWPSIDEDISIDGLLGIIHQREHRKRVA
jgi:hypothetical protein